MDIGTIHSIWTVLLFVSFIGIVIWAYSKRRHAEFEEAANLVFADDNKKLKTSTSNNDRS